MSIRTVGEFGGTIGSELRPEAGRPVTAEEIELFGRRMGKWVGRRRHPFEHLDPVEYNERDLWKVGPKHLHLVPRFSLYNYVRFKLGWSLEQLSRVSKLSPGVVRARDQQRVMYHPSELVALKRLSGMSWDDIGILLEAMG